MLFTRFGIPARDHCITPSDLDQEFIINVGKLEQFTCEHVGFGSVSNLSLGKHQFDLEPVIVFIHDLFRTSDLKGSLGTLFPVRVSEFVIPLSHAVVCHRRRP